MKSDRASAAGDLLHARAALHAILNNDVKSGPLKTFKDLKSTDLVLLEIANIGTEFGTKWRLADIPVGAFLRGLQIMLNAVDDQLHFLGIDIEDGK